MRGKSLIVLSPDKWNEIGLKISICQNLIDNILTDLHGVVQASNIDKLIKTYNGFSIIKSNLEDEMFRQKVNFKLGEHDIHVFYRNHIDDEGSLDFKHLNGDVKWQFKIQNLKSTIKA